MALGVTIPQSLFGKGIWQQVRRHSRIWMLGWIICLLAFLTACQPRQASEGESSVLVSSKSPAGNPSQEAEDSEEEMGEMKMKVEVAGTVFTATLENNKAVQALVALMEEAPVTIAMDDYAGFEKVGSLGTNLPASDRQTTTNPGTLCCTRETRLSCFTATIPGAIPALGRSMT